MDNAIIKVEKIGVEEYQAIDLSGLALDYKELCDLTSDMAKAGLFEKLINGQAIILDISSIKELKVNRDAVYLLNKEKCANGKQEYVDERTKLFDDMIEMINQAIIIIDNKDLIFMLESNNLEDMRKKLKDTEKAKAEYIKERLK